MKHKDNVEYFFSPSTVSFYPCSMLDDYVNAGTLPDDIVPIDSSLFYEFSGTPPDSKVRGAVNGMPAWVDLPPPTKENMVNMASDEKQRRMLEATAFIDPLSDAVDLDMSTPEEEVSLKAWRKYRVLLNRVDVSLAPDIEWPVKPE